MIRERIKLIFLDKADAWLEKQRHPVPRLLRSPTGMISDDEIQDFLQGAAMREDPLWEKIEDLLLDLQERNPFRVAQTRANIRWLRKQAYSQGLPWGKKK